MDELMEAALKARIYAYVPYSNFKVGAAVLGKSGRIYAGCNVENASYGLCNCAERTAIYKAVSEGETAFQAIAVIADTDAPTPPCGACRQVIAEFEIPEIRLANVKGRQRTFSLNDLLPYSFSGRDLKKEI